MSDCNHKAKVCTGTTNGRAEYLCVRCGMQLSGSRDGKVPKAPRGWQDMSPDELKVWFAKNVVKADLSGHLASYERKSDG